MADIVKHYMFMHFNSFGRNNEVDKKTDIFCLVC